jgi:hypothetical protein
MGNRKCGEIEFTQIDFTFSRLINSICYLDDVVGKHAPMFLTKVVDGL